MFKNKTGWTYLVCVESFKGKEELGSIIDAEGNEEPRDLDDANAVWHMTYLEDMNDRGFELVSTIYKDKSFWFYFRKPR